jgi:hypothetical protein
MATVERLRNRLHDLAPLQIAVAIGAIGLLLVLPSLTADLQALDDAQQRDFILAHLHASRPDVPGSWNAQRSWYDVYALVGGDAHEFELSRHQWLRPWWSWPGLKVRFFRPVAAATLYLDYFISENNHVLAHLHSALWYFVACASVTMMLLRLTKRRETAVLASLLFTLDDAHAAPVLWLAARNAVIGVAFMANAVTLFDVAAARESWRVRLASLSCVLCALLAAENAISGVPLFVAHALFLDKRSPLRRLAAVAALFAVVLAWLVVHNALGFGTKGSGAYLDPLSDPTAYTAAFSGRYVELLRIHFTAPWQLQPTIPLSWLVGVDLLSRWVLFPALLIFIVRNVDRSAEVAFWVFSAAAGLVPLTAADPHQRLLMIVGISLWSLVAHCVVGLLDKGCRASRLWRFSAVVAVVFVLGLHTVLAPIGLAVASAPSNPDLPSALAASILDRNDNWQGQDLFVISVPSLMTSVDMVNERRRRQLRIPNRVAVLGATIHEVEVTRTGAQTFELYSPPGYLLDTFSSFWRGPSAPFVQSERVSVEQFTAQIIRVTPDGRPLRVRFTFQKNLDDPTLKFLCWTDGAFALFRFAPIGQRKIIPATFDQSHQLPEELVQ